MQKNKYFKSMDYYGKRQAKASLAEYLRTQEGWEVFGYKEDKSDSMTDYFDPATWDGIARYGEFILVVDNSTTRESGKEITKQTQHYKPCEHCLETGAEPNGWMYEDAKADPKGFWKKEADAGHGVMMTSLSGNYVPRDFFNEDGTEKCNKCRGKKEVYSHSTYETLGHWPTFQANPNRKMWHMEKNGEILISGISIATMYRGYWDGNLNEQYECVAVACKQFVDQLMIAMAPKPASTSSSTCGIYERDEPIKSGKFEIIDYSEKAIALRGDTKPFKEKLSNASGGIGGKFNAHLKDPGTGEKFAGWIFSKKKRRDVEEFVRLHS